MPQADESPAAQPAQGEPSEPLEPGALAFDLQQELARLQEENERLSHQLLRLQADFENFRRRFRLELERQVDEAVGKLAARLLPVVDNLERALAVAGGAGQDAGEAGSTHSVLQGLVTGLRMVHQELLRALAEEGIQRIAAEGEPFDPAVHQVVEQVPVQAPEQDRRVLQELQPGYHFKGRVLRPSLVRVGVLVAGEGACEPPATQGEAPAPS